MVHTAQSFPPYIESFLALGRLSATHRCPSARSRNHHVDPRRVSGGEPT